MASKGRLRKSASALPRLWNKGLARRKRSPPTRRDGCPAPETLTRRSAPRSSRQIERRRDYSVVRRRTLCYLAFILKEQSRADDLAISVILVLNHRCRGKPEHKVREIQTAVQAELWNRRPARFRVIDFLHKGQPEIVVDCRAEDMCVSKGRLVVPLAAAVSGGWRREGASDLSVAGERQRQ